MMLRMSMAQPLHDVFKGLGKRMTKTNCAQLCAMACATPEIFFAPAVGPYEWFMYSDVKASYLYTRELNWYDPYAVLVEKVLSAYNKDTFTDPIMLQQLFDALDDKIATIRKLLLDDGFPDLVR